MAKPLEIDEIWLNRIASSVNGMEYGNVQIIVHDGRIVQIERTERKRFDAETALAARGTSAPLSKSNK
ncbi:YezD family protein [Paenibacillus thalictri]|uniref:DUF2292 domain-containing protein n=1 Tax=Paenibacillus thalictri TaxID=2527873 RepID=A0A4V2J4M1_9BACL|nr:YezD family protein [Paenibacillus thalictri]TBL80341.1 DUF2292 domain-containing protein [Paenibacillus thalictri]